MGPPSSPSTSRSLMPGWSASRSEEHTSELQSRQYLVCRLLLEKIKSLPADRVHIVGFFFKDSGTPGNLPSLPTRPSADLATLVTVRERGVEAAKDPHALVVDVDFHGPPQLNGAAVRPLDQPVLDAGVVGL